MSIYIYKAVDSKGKVIKIYEGKQIVLELKKQIVDTERNGKSYYRVRAKTFFICRSP